MGFFKKIFGGLAKTASAVTQGISAIFTGKALSDEFYDDLMAVLLQTDMGMEAVERVIDDIKKVAKKQGIKTEEDLKDALAKSISEQLSEHTSTIGDELPMVMMIVGVNGVGKTTSIGKLASYYKADKKSVLIAAGDTFRAAASEQLFEWSKRADVRIVKHAEGADPAAVVFDALHSAKSKKEDVTIIDTAGRLHNKSHLMEELKKIDRVVNRQISIGEAEGWKPVYKKLIVLDATTGQNALSQVEIFNEAVELDGVILTKLDGTAKGGVAIAIKQKFGLPVFFVGVGEKVDDLLPFDPDTFAKAIVGIDS